LSNLTARFSDLISVTQAKSFPTYPFSAELTDRECVPKLSHCLP
jgi:hypothetical protein